MCETECTPGALDADMVIKIILKCLINNKKKLHVNI